MARDGGSASGLVLLLTSAVLGGFMMFVYSGLLLVLNRRAPPRAIRTGPWRIRVMALVFLFFGFFSVLTIIDQIQEHIL